MPKDDFYITDPGCCYMDGNSLGRLPLATRERLKTLVDQGWGHDLIRGWNSDWIDLPQRIGDKIAGLIGAGDGEVVVADSTTVNLFKLATAALRYQAPRSVVVSDAANFPSDLYALQSALASSRGPAIKGTSEASVACDVRLVGPADTIDPPLDELLAAFDSNTALVCLSHVGFRSGALYPMHEITQAAHAVGAMVLWDLSHSVGVVPIDLENAQVDLAIGCTYKYLCGGPGAPAFLYVRRALQEKLSNPIAGWFSHRQPFHFDEQYQAAGSIAKFLTGTPPVLSLAAIEAGVDAVTRAGIETLRARSVELTSFLMEACVDRLEPMGISVRSPREAKLRGSHISLGHPEAQRITENLIVRHNVIPDFRVPDNLRIGVAPLYTSEREITCTVDAIEKTIRDREYETIALPAGRVT